MFQLNLNPSNTYAVRYQYHGEQPIVRDADLNCDHGMSAQATRDTLWFVVSCAADEHAENPDVYLDFIEVVACRKRLGRKAIFRMSRDCMSPAEMREAYDAIMDPSFHS